MYGQYSISSDYRLPNNWYLFNSRFKQNAIKFSLAHRFKNWQNIFRYQLHEEATGIPGHVHSSDLKGVWKAKVITLFPNMFPGSLSFSLVGRALQNELWTLETIDLRSFGEGKHKNVDDTPAGGGAGMILRADVIEKAINYAQSSGFKKNPIVCLSARGKKFNQKMAKKFSKCDGITLLCGRFEGVDQRVLDFYNVQEISIGDFIMTGGEIPAQALLDSIVRLLPDVLGNEASLEDESFSNGLLEHPQFTRPAVWNDLEIPEILQSGNHEKIRKWRLEKSELVTKERRSDMWADYIKSADEIKKID